MKCGHGRCMQGLCTHHCTTSYLAAKTTGCSVSYDPYDRISAHMLPNTDAGLSSEACMEHGTSTQTAENPVQDLFHSCVLFPHTQQDNPPAYWDL